MQPKTEAKTKQNLESSRENKKEISPIDQWDAVAFKLIKDELAPKGYSEIKRGPWRGKVQSNIPFLPKRSVERCQQIAAQMVKAFREKAKAELKSGIENYEGTAKTYQEGIDKLSWFQFKKRREYGRKLIEAKAKASILNGAMGRMDLINIK